jgi:hypothetical protein
MRIDIKEPCNENWDGMGPNLQGKHCSKCEKTVYDFSNYSDSEIIDFFKSGPNVCGRFSGTQLGRDLTHTRSFSPKWTIAACGLLFLSSVSLNAQNNPQVSKDSSQEAVSQMSVVLTRVINATFNEASTRDACISRMRIKIDSFAIEVDIDSSHKSSVTVPQTLSGERVDVELFNIKGDTFHLDSVHLGMGDIVFIPMANGRWMYTNPLNYYVWSIPEPPIIHSMGIPSPYIWGPTFLPTIVVAKPIDTSIVLKMGDTVLSKELVNPDSNKRTVMGNIIIPKKQGFKLGPWTIGILIGLSGLMFWAWRKFKNKIKA